jgi:outer membrane protein assembly factor BamA
LETHLEKRRGIRITGLSTVDLQQINRAIRSIGDDSEKLLTPDGIENILWLVFRELHGRGFAEAKISLLIRSKDGKTMRQTGTSIADFNISEDVHPDYVSIATSTGKRNVIRWLRIDGIDTLTKREQISMFYRYSGLYVFPRERYYTSQRLHLGILKLRNALMANGYRSAQLKSQCVDHLDNGYGIHLLWDQGERHIIREIVVRIHPADGVEFDKNPFLQAMGNIWQLYPELPATDGYIGQQIQLLRRQFYGAGYADARFDYELKPIENGEGEHCMRLIISVETGFPMTVGNIFLEPQSHFHRPFFLRRLHLDSGMPLNPDLIIGARERLQSLSTCEFIGIRYDSIDENGSCDVHFLAKERERNEIFLRVGGGNYDVMRIGMNWNQNNLWKMAHSGRLKAIQSVRRTNLSYDYQIPEIMGSHTSLFFFIEYLRRKEMDFTRREESLAIGVERKLGNGVRVAFQYEWSHLYTASDALEQELWKRFGNAGALSISLECNHLNNPLYPKHGRRWLMNLEIVLPPLGGDFSYGRWEGEFTKHISLGPTTFFHSALRHGLIRTFGNPQNRQPFSKRFFCGGASSMRGFHEGQASPVDGGGNIIGAEAYTLINLELEQCLFNRLSCFLFFDGIGFCQDMHHYPMTQHLLSAGPGVSYETFIGPMRLALSWNFHRRHSDPDLYLRFSIGFPF